MLSQFIGPAWGRLQREEKGVEPLGFARSAKLD